MNEELTEATYGRYNYTRWNEMPYKKGFPTEWLAAKRPKMDLFVSQWKKDNYAIDAVRGGSNG